MAEWEENSKSDRYLLDPGVQLERGRALVDSPGDVPVDDIRAYVARSIKKEDDRLAAEREAALADQKRIADAERKAREAAEEKTFIEQAARKDAEVSASKLRMRLMAAVAAVAFAGVFGFVSYYEYKRASQQTIETQRQLDRANQALAQSINSALGLDPSTPFSPFQRNALWKLAAADEPVKRAFVSMLAASPEEMARASPGYPQIFRALGPERPSPAEAENLVSAVLGGLKTTEGTNNVKFLVAELRVLTPKLAETHEKRSARYAAAENRAGNRSGGAPEAGAGDPTTAASALRLAGERGVCPITAADRPRNRSARALNTRAGTPGSTR
jgi:hypothetical protein